MKLRQATKTKNDEPSLVAVDWGTSSFRLWVLTASAKVLQEASGPFGMASLSPGHFSNVLESQLQELQIDVHVPIIICGMAGAAQGWIDAGYVTIPDSLNAIAQHAVDAPDTKRTVKILPGVATALETAPDVMRGEETLLMGALLDKVSGTICMPGTHSKWAVLDNGTLMSFSTALTGELFALLQTQSTLSVYLHNELVESPQSNGANHTLFCRGVEQSLNEPEKTLQQLFAIRATALRMGRSKQASSSLLSGLLIGLEIAGMRSAFSGPITLISGASQSSLYKEALQLAEFEVICLSSEETVRKGLVWAAQSIWPSTALA